MGLEESLREAAQKFIDGQEVIDVAVFSPKGTQIAASVGLSLGGLAGGAMSSDTLGRSIGAAWGLFAAQALNEMRTEIPTDICVAITDSHVYLLGMKNKVSSSGLWPLTDFARDSMSINVNKKLTRTEVTLSDDDSGTVELELPALNLYDGKAIVELLMLSPQHLQD